MLIPFSKYSGCGNDFIFIDHRSQRLSPFPNPKGIKRLCHRQFGIGADGVIFLENSSIADFRMRIINADGSEAEMCGNGLRCIARFIRDLGIPEQSPTIETMHHCLQVSLKENGLVRATMPPPTNFAWNTSLSIQNSPITLHCVDTGVPHAILFVDDLESSHHMNIAPHIRSHPHFPKGTNVNFAKIISNNFISVRTLERGVDNETLACGTGMVATAIAAAVIHRLASPLTIQARSNDLLSVSFSGPNYANVVMEGPAVKIFQGEFLAKSFGFT